MRIYLYGSTKIAQYIQYEEIRITKLKKCLRAIDYEWSNGLTVECCRKTYGSTVELCHMVEWSNGVGTIRPFN